MVVEHGLNPFQPTLEFFRRWEGDAGALLRPKALVPRGAIMKNVQGKKAVQTKLDKHLEVGAGILRKDLKHFSDMYDGKLWNVIPDRWKFSTFYNDFVNNRIVLKNIPAFNNLTDPEATDFDPEVCTISAPAAVANGTQDARKAKSGNAKEEGSEDNNDDESIKKRRLVRGQQVSRRKEEPRGKNPSFRKGEAGIEHSANPQDGQGKVRVQLSSEGDIFDATVLGLRPCVRRWERRDPFAVRMGLSKQPD